MPATARAIGRSAPLAAGRMEPGAVRADWAQDRKLAAQLMEFPRAIEAMKKRAELLEQSIQVMVGLKPEPGGGGGVVVSAYTMSWSWSLSLCAEIHQMPNDGRLPISRAKFARALRVASVGRTIIRVVLEGVCAMRLQRQSQQGPPPAVSKMRRPLDYSCYSCRVTRLRPWAELLLCRFIATSACVAMVVPP